MDRAGEDTRAQGGGVMTPGHRAFLEKYAGLWSQRAAERRAVGALVDLRIAGTLEGFVAEMRTELAADPAQPKPEPVADDPDQITWRSPVFNVGGRLNPFAGTKRDGWLASADACERLGYPDIGETYRCMAAQVDPNEMPDRCGYLKPVASDAPQVPDADPTARSRRSPPRRRSSWTGPPMPPPEPTPFKAAGQMDMFA